jgi:hypothetical protein
MKHSLHVVVVSLALLAAACGGNDSPSAPSSSAAPSTTGITITLADTLAVGTTAQATATATLSNGQSQALATGFLSDSPSVATVTTGGLVTSVSRGAANIYIVSGGRQGTKPIRVIANYQGNWSGRYTVTGCNQQGIFATIDGCRQVGVGSSLVVGMVMTQTGETVTGRVNFGSLNSENASVPMGVDGSLVFVARVPGDPIIDVNMNLAQNDANQITGTLLQNWRTVGAFGTMQIAGTISSPLGKTSAPFRTSVLPNGIADRLGALFGR